MGAMDLTGVIPTTREMVMVVIMIVVMMIVAMMIVAMIVLGRIIEHVMPIRKAIVLEETAVVLNTECHLLMKHALVLAEDFVMTS
jgi:hypothetical protein